MALVNGLPAERRAGQYAPLGNADDGVAAKTGVELYIWCGRATVENVALKCR